MFDISRFVSALPPTFSPPSHSATTTHSPSPEQVTGTGNYGFGVSRFLSALPPPPPPPPPEQVMYKDKDGNMRACSGRVESVTDRVRTPPRLPPRACRSWWRRRTKPGCRPSYKKIKYDKCIIVEDFSTIQYKKQNKNDCVLLIIAIILLILFLLESKC
jgi:hypothetical protein